jgi:hypothetical protein
MHVSERIMKVLPLFVVVASKSLHKPNPIQCQYPMGTAPSIPY